MKRMDSTVYQVIEATMNGSFEGGLTVGTLENGGVGLAPSHDMDGIIPDDLKAEVEALREGIIGGSIKVGG